MIIFIILLIVILTFVVLQLPTFGAEPKGKRLERLKKFKYYKNDAFYNIHNTPAIAKGFDSKKVMIDFFFGEKNPDLRPKKIIPHVKTNLLSIPKSENVFIWFGHSSYYLQVDGVSFLIDPVFSNYGSPLPIFNKVFKGSNTYLPKDFPEIDYLVISHDHYDHLDYETVKKLRHKINNVILPLGVGAHFEKWRYKPEQLIEEEWWTPIVLKNNLKITFTPARHFSGRKFKRNSTLWTSYVLETSDKTIFLGGDSGYDTHFKEIGEKLGPFDFAILENGQYNEAWRYIHTLPNEIPMIVSDLKAKNIIPVHSSKFALAKHAWDEPLKKIKENSKEYNFPILTPKIGEIVKLNEKSFSFDEWWKE